MAQFHYTAIDARGGEKSGSLESADSRQLAALLREQGLFPTTIVPAGESRKDQSRDHVQSVPATKPGHDRKEGRAALAWNPFSRRVTPRELSVLTRQMSTLLRAGMPLLRGLEVLARQERSIPLRRTLDDLAATIRSGGTLSGALAQHPRVFDRLYLNMIKAGEAGGVLDVVLDRLARFQEKSRQLKGKIAAALLYPLIVLGVAITILVGLLVFVVPKFQQIFADLLKGAPLPPLTQFVLTLSDLVKHHSLVVVSVVGVLWVGGKFASRTAAGIRFIDRGLIHLPLFGELFLKGIVARFGRTLGTLLSSGVPILPALLITRDTCGNAVVADAITTVHDRVKEGAPVAASLEATKVFPPMVTSMMDVGEHTGQMPEMLGKVADIYEDEVDNAIAGLSSLIEPLMILLLALMVGTIVIALFLPIVRIVQLLT